MGEVDDIDSHIVLLEPHTHVFEVFFSTSKWMANEYDNSLSLGFVLSMLK